MASVPSNPWVVRPRPAPSPRLRIFCFAHAGGGASTYRLWAQDVPPDVDVAAVQLPGRESRWRDQPFTDVRQVVPAIAEGVRPLLDVPFVLFGHSLGGLLAFQLAAALRASGGPQPLRLVVSAHRAPDRPNPHSPVSHLGDDAFLQEVGRRYGGVPAAVLESPELLALVLPTLRADIRMFEGYVHAPVAPLSCPITALGGTEDKYVVADELAGWQDQTTGGFAMRLLPGDHFYLAERRAEVLRSVLEDVSGRPHAGVGASA
jgi:medium-chain acyl-[acyl-carrier-protein] hydrolase